ncbi:jg1306 [Pararge aegeria aegeria]|uniref:Jg1306 protein n=1 Tax=Pararge aegeria aegeria TaxID=348720 RepID=A0A8S4SIH8_9NEOP|nr:jg1306 [Pararge aegeria aegeria]
MKWQSGHIARRTHGRWVTKVQNGDPAPVNAELVDSRRGGRMTSGITEPLDPSDTRPWYLELPTKDQN